MAAGKRVVLGVSDVMTGNYFMRELIAELTLRGHDPLWFAGGGRTPDASIAPSLQRIESLKRTISVKDDLRALRVIIKLLRQLRPPVVHFSTPKAALLGMMAAKICRVPKRVYLVRGLRLETASGPGWLLLWMLERLTAFCATDVVCVSRSVAERSAQMKLAPRKRMIVLGQGSSCGVDTLRFASTAERAEQALATRRSMGIEDDRVVLGCVGRLNKAKGVEEVLTAFTKLRARHKVALICLGDLDPGEPISAEAEAVLRGGGDVYWLPHVEDAAASYHLFDILVLATYREGFPNVVLEASSAGLPVVTTTATGAVDSVVDGSTGLLVPPADVDALVTAVARLIEHPEERERMGKAGFARCQRYFERADVIRLHADHLVGESALSVAVQTAQKERV
jgi:glycosyltransferase involved in cell wall biosynthesis